MGLLIVPLRDGSLVGSGEASGEVVVAPGVVMMMGVERVRLRSKRGWDWGGCSIQLTERHASVCHGKALDVITEARTAASPQGTCTQC